MKYLGIDYGEQKVGTALSDDAGSVAFPHEVFPNEEPLVETLAALVRERGVGSVVIGESKDLTGAPNPVHEKARQFAEALGKRAEVPVHFEPEYFTSVEASRTQGRHEKLDASAAAIILQSFLDKREDRK